MELPKRCSRVQMVGTTPWPKEQSAWGLQCPLPTAPAPSGAADGDRWAELCSGTSPCDTRLVAHTEQLIHATTGRSSSTAAEHRSLLPAPSPAPTALFQLYFLHSAVALLLTTNSLQFQRCPELSSVPPHSSAVSGLLWGNLRLSQSRFCWKTALPGAGRAAHEFLAVSHFQWAICNSEKSSKKTLRSVLSRGKVRSVTSAGRCQLREKIGSNIDQPFVRPTGAPDGRRLRHLGRCCVAGSSAGSTARCGWEGSRGHLERAPHHALVFCKAQGPRWKNPSSKAPGWVKSQPLGATKRPPCASPSPLLTVSQFSLFWGAKACREEQDGLLRGVLAGWALVEGLCSCRAEVGTPGAPKFRFCT